MKKFLFLFLGLNILACQGTKEEEKKPVKADDEIAAIALAVETLKNTILNPTQSSLLAVTHPDMTYGHSSGTIEDRVEFMEVLLSGKNDYKAFEISEQTIKVSGETAWVRHIMDATIDIPESSVEVRLDVLTTWVKMDGDWILFARQAFKY